MNLCNDCAKKEDCAALYWLTIISEDNGVEVQVVQCSKKEINGKDTNKSKH